MASKLTNSDINEIAFQSDVESFPLRTNFSNLKNKVNEVIDDVAAAAVGTTNAETTAARPYHTNLKERLDSDSFTYLKSGGTLTEQGVPDMTVAVAAGEAKINGIDVKWAAQNSGTITAPGSNTRLDYVVANSDSTLSVVTGTALASPVFPSISSTQIILGCIVVKSSTTTLNEGTEIFNLIHGNKDFYPDIYVNSNTTLTADINYNNLIVDDGVYFDTTSSYFALCQGYCHLISLNNAGTDGSAEENDSLVNQPSYTNSTNWTIWAPNGNDVSDWERLDGSGGIGGSNITHTLPRGVGGTSTTRVFRVKAFSVFVNTATSRGGDGYTPLSTTDPNSYSANYPSGSFEVGASGGTAGNAAEMYIEAVDAIEVRTTLSTRGGNAGDGVNANAGSVGNLGGSSPDGGNGANMTLLYKTLTNNGTISVAAGATGTPGTGTLGSDANKNGHQGATGSAGTLTSTAWDFTTGMSSGYASWIKDLNILKAYLA